jgi:hypothetical protein
MVVHPVIRAIPGNDVQLKPKNPKLLKRRTP